MEFEEIEAALDGVVTAIDGMPASRSRDRLRTLSSILRRVIVTWQLTPPSPAQQSFVWHQVADLLLEAKQASAIAASEGHSAR